MRILAVDDNVATREFLDVLLGRHGFSVRTAGSAAEALGVIDSEPIDLVILDLWLPDRDGLALCREIRARPRYVPVLMLTARDQVGDELAGFAAAADDYLRKPAEPEVLLARIRALQRVGRSGPTRETVQLSGGIQIDLRARELSRAGRVVPLGRRSFDLLVWFAEHPGRWWSKRQLVDYVWGGEDPPVESTVEWHINQIREALGDTGRELRYLQTRARVGYLMPEQVVVG